MIFAILMTAAAPAAPEAIIRAERARLNAAIAAHDWEAMMPSFLPDYTIFPGSSGRPFDVTAFGKRIGDSFADPTFVAFVRTPERIRISQNGKRASETGHWVGTWRKADGTMRLSGTYLGTWEPVEEGWKLKNEAYVSLACTGSKACAETY
jgi:ketosteroid isomerase-like protein